jgi:hypothetical protein
MFTDTSQENFKSALSREPENKKPKKTIPTKPSFKKKLEYRTETSPQSNRKETEIRESSNHSQISQIEPPKDEDYLPKQKITP